MRFQLVACNIIQITRKRINKIEATYTLERTVLENEDSTKYLGVTITHDLKWNTCVTKANRTLSFLRRNLYQCPQDLKEAAYEGLQEEIDKVQNSAARFVTSSYRFETGSMTESLKKRKRDSRLILLYKGLKGAASIPTDNLIAPIRYCRNHHSLAFQTPTAKTDIYKGSFFPNH